MKIFNDRYSVGRTRTARKSTMQMIKDYQEKFDQSKGMKFSETSEIICQSRNKMEIAGNSYLFGHMRGSQQESDQCKIPLYNIPQITDERWNELAKTMRRK